MIGIWIELDKTSFLSQSFQCFFASAGIANGNGKSFRLSQNTWEVSIYVKQQMFLKYLDSLKEKLFRVMFTNGVFWKDVDELCFFLFH